MSSDVGGRLNCLKGGSFIWYSDFLGINTNIFGLPSREGHLSLVKSDVIVLMSMGLSSVPHIPCSVPVIRMMQQKQSFLEKSLCAVSVSAFNMSLVVRWTSSLVVKRNSSEKTLFSVRPNLLMG